MQIVGTAYNEAHERVDGVERLIVNRKIDENERTAVYDQDQLIAQTVAAVMIELLRGNRSKQGEFHIKVMP